MTGKSNDSLQTPAQEPGEFAFLIPERPVPKGRPRMSRKGKVYTPTETVSAEKAYIEAVGDDHPVYEGAVRLELTFQEYSTSVVVTPVDDWHTKLRGDIDNYIKLALDGIQRAGIIANDRQVVHVDAVKI